MSDEQRLPVWAVRLLTGIVAVIFAILVSIVGFIVKDARDQFIRVQEKIDAVDRRVYGVEADVKYLRRVVERNEKEDEP